MNAQGIVQLCIYVTSTIVFRTYFYSLIEGENDI